MDKIIGTVKGFNIISSNEPFEDINDFSLSFSQAIIKLKNALDNQKVPLTPRFIMMSKREYRALKKQMYEDSLTPEYKAARQLRYDAKNKLGKKKKKKKKGKK